MAKDFALKHVCPHYVLNEWLAVEEDRVTLNTVRYPSSSKIEIEANGHLVPRDGLKAPAKVTGRVSQPYQILNNTNDQLRLRVNNGPLQVLYLPTGTAVSVNQVVDAINEQATGIKAEAANGRVSLTTEAKGEDATLLLQSGTAHETLGFQSTRFYQGRLIIPGWDLVKVPNTVDQFARQIKFRQPLSSTDDILELSYYTRRQDCRRCSGLGLENDIRHDNRGEPSLVTGINLLAQEVEKIVFTIRGSNVFHQWYGTSINDLIGSKIIRGGSFVSNQLRNEIATTLERFRQVKSNQATLQPVGDQEFLQRVRTISVVQDDVNPTIFRIRVEIQNAASEIEQITQTLVLNTTPEGQQLVG